MDEIRIGPEPLDEQRLRSELGGEQDGAVVCFAGIVRRTEGELVLSGIDYEAYDSMATKLLREILVDAHARWPPFRARIAHRTGIVAVGEASVWIGVAAGHREAAFEVCRFLIDELKTRVPIWKAEHRPLG